MKHSGMVMEILSDGKAIVITKDGQFLSVVPHNKVDIGEETTFTLEKERKTSYFSKQNIRWIASVAAVLLILFVGVPGYFFGTTDQVAAYVSVDINPSIDLGVSKKGKVIEVRALNQDGQYIVKIIGDRLKNIPIDQATALIVSEAHKQGFLKPDGDILITMTKVSQRPVPEQEWKEKITQSIDKQKSEIKDVSMISLTTSAQIRQEAEKNGLSTGKYTFYVIAQNKGYAVTIDQLKEQSVHEIIQNIPELKTVMSQKMTTDEIDREYQALQDKHEQEKEKQQMEQKQKTEENSMDRNNSKNPNGQQQEKQKENQQEKQQEKRQGNPKETEHNNKPSNQSQKIQLIIQQKSNEHDENEWKSIKEEVKRFSSNDERKLIDQKKEEDKGNSYNKDNGEHSRDSVRD
ncbi:anti-sigma factor domain-containing protein [Tepidibacillus marianensis]|uniref:anti-sigma factor domain-containing protein n=1 Tax=Tepidibacillus marianensis TaxID=3131995 RepID=UPI0030CD96B3